MKLSRIHIRTVVIYSLVVILSCGHPMVAMAADSTASPTTATPTTSTASNPNYTYDATTDHWNSDKWYYDSLSGKYEPVVAQTTTAPDSSTSTAPTSDSNTPLAQASTTVSSGGPEATAAATATADSSTSNSSAITTDTTSVAQSGNATVANNMVAGSATSGSAQAADTLINMVNSSTGGSGVVSFTSNVSGDVNGDIQLYPMILSAMASRGVISNSANNQSATGSTDVANNNNITNNVDLSATSGTASVSGNTSAGSATSGNADTVVNVMNLINSMVAYNQSFVGVINIYGNLNGNILLAPDFIPQLIASNAGTPGASSITVDNTSLINNNISLDATSGTASVSGNTSAGSATSGTAKTNIVLLNLSGHQVVASNSLLVFVNVLGKWVGVIVDAPAGSTAAVIGSGVSQNNTSTTTTVPVVVDNNAQITNNIRLSSQSGNASVTNNTNAGSAVSGSATASANVFNMTQSTFGLSGWFGALFINVFGSWLGSFGVSAPISDPVLPIVGESTNTTPTSQPPSLVRFISRPAVLHVAASPAIIQDTTTYTPAAGQPATADQSSNPAAVLGASTTSSPSGRSYSISTLVGLIIIMLALAGAVIGRRLWPTLLRRS